MLKTATVAPQAGAPSQSLLGGRNPTHLIAVLFFIGALGFAATAWSMGDTFYLRLATEALIFAGLAISVDILLGYTGLLSLGQALWFGVGAYTSAVVLRSVEPSFWLAMGATLVLTTVAGAIGGIIANRVNGVYFALITFGLAQVAARIVYNTRELGASDGLIGVPQITIPLGLITIDAASPIQFFLFVLVLMLLLYIGLAYLMDTPFGRTLAAIKANERRVPFLGVNPKIYRVLAYVLAANVAALAGALYPMLRGFVSPELLYFAASGNAVITVIVGGAGTLIGPILGAVLLSGMRSVIGTWTEHQIIFIGVLFMIAVVSMPKGLVGAISPLLSRLFGKSEQSR